MKIKLVLAEITLCAGLAAVSGYQKEQPAADAQAPKANESVTPAPAKAVETATTAAPQVTRQAAAQAQLAKQQAHRIS